MCLPFNKCCCCMNLDVGTKIIAVISMISSASIVVLYGTPAVLLRTLPPSRLLFYEAMAVTATLQFIFACMLIYGALKKKPKFTLPWIILLWWESMMLLVLSVGGMILLAWYSETESAAQTSAVISVFFIYAVILYYFTSVVNSWRVKMLREDHTDSAKRLMRPDTTLHDWPSLHNDNQVP